MNTVINDNTINADKMIEMTLRLLGLNNSYKGFDFLIYGINLVIDNPGILTYICKGLYAEIAIHYNTTVNCVERNIRTAKDIIWTNGNKDLLTDIFGELHGSSLPSNAQFIDTLTYYIKSNLREANTGSYTMKKAEQS